MNIKFQFDIFHGPGNIEKAIDLLDKKEQNDFYKFIVKYSMDGQKHLEPHHDSSTYTLNLCLNNDFEGGGCRFVRQNFILNNKNIGYACIHPGRLTHYHEGIQITSGKRLILVCFIN